MWLPCCMLVTSRALSRGLPALVSVVLRWGSVQISSLTSCSVLASGGHSEAASDPHTTIEGCTEVSSLHCRRLHADAVPGEHVWQSGGRALQPHGHQLLPFPRLHTHQVCVQVVTVLVTFASLHLQAQTTPRVRRRSQSARCEHSHQ